MDIYIPIDDNSRIPKYQQIINFIINEIAKGNLKLGERLPSINELSADSNLSRDTVEKAYRHLKETKVIESVRGKGYYTSKTDFISKINVLFLVNKLSSYKMHIYNAFVHRLGSTGNTNLNIYHCDEFLFLNQLEKNLGGFDYYVIMPHFKNDKQDHVSLTDKVREAINKIPEDRLIILDNKLHAVESAIQIYQDFENDIYNALKEGLFKMVNYERLLLIYPEKAAYPYPRRILHGFKKFCTEHSLDFEILDEIYVDMVLKKKDLFIIIEEADLVILVKQIRELKLDLGKDIGIISYNDTALKELLGITVISTDFTAMGETAADMIVSQKRGLVRNPFNLIIRPSL